MVKLSIIVLVERAHAERFHHQVKEVVAEWFLQSLTSLILQNKEQYHTSRTWHVEACAS
jgi:hypothetical protein